MEFVCDGSENRNYEAVAVFEALYPSTRTMRISIQGLLK